MAHYRIELTPDDNGTFLVTAPRLPEVTTWGEDEASALRNAANAVEEALAARLKADEDIPPWASFGLAGSYMVRLPTLTALKVSLQRALKHRGWTRADLQRAMDAHRTQVDRLFDLNHASRIEQIEEAFAALDYGRPVLVAVDEAPELLNA